MNFTLRALLRAALIPAAAAVITHEVQSRRDEADELAALVDERRRYLAGEGPLPEADDPEAGDPEAEPEDFRAAARSSTRPAGGFPVRSLVAGVAGLVAGVLVGRAVGRWQATARIAGELAALTTPSPEAHNLHAGDELPADVLAEVEHAAKHPGTVVPTLASCPEHSPDVDEHQDVDEPAGPDLYVCTYGNGVCSYVAPAGPPEQRALRLSFHRSRVHGQGVS